MNTMKRRGAALLLALALLLSSSACGKEDDLRRALREAAKDAPIVKSGILPDEVVDEGIESAISRITSEVECTFDGGVLTISGDGAEIDKRTWIPVVSETIFETDENECRRAVEKIVIEDGITKIWEKTFADCINLKEISIPDSVTFIGDEAFSGCAGWRIPDGADTSGSIWSAGDVLGYFDASQYCYDCCTYAGIYPPLDPGEMLEWTGLTQVELPDGLTFVGDYAFAGCRNLISATNVSCVGRHMFSECSYLAAVQISEAADSIETQAFFDCVRLAEITIPGSVTGIREAAFAGCSSLTEIALPENVIYTGGGLFVRSGLTKITIPASVTKWGDSSITPGFDFYNHSVLDCESLTDITFLGDAALEDVESMLYQPMQYAREYQYYNGEERPLTVRAPSGSVIEGYCNRQIEKGDAPFLTFIPI